MKSPTAKRPSLEEFGIQDDVEKAIPSAPTEDAAYVTSLVAQAAHVSRGTGFTNSRGPPGIRGASIDRPEEERGCDPIPSAPLYPGEEILEGGYAGMQKEGTVVAREPEEQIHEKGIPDFLIPGACFASSAKFWIASTIEKDSQFFSDSHYGSTTFKIVLDSYPGRRSGLFTPNAYVHFLKPVKILEQGGFVSMSSALISAAFPEYKTNEARVFMTVQGFPLLSACRHYLNGCEELEIRMGSGGHSENASHVTYAQYYVNKIKSITIRFFYKDSDMAFWFAALCFQQPHLRGQVPGVLWSYIRICICHGAALRLQSLYEKEGAPQDLANYTSVPCPMITHAYPAKGRGEPFRPGHEGYSRSADVDIGLVGGLEVPYRDNVRFMKPFHAVVCDSSSGLRAAQKLIRSSQPGDTKKPVVEKKRIALQAKKEATMRFRSTVGYLVMVAGYLCLVGFAIVLLFLIYREGVRMNVKLRKIANN